MEFGSAVLIDIARFYGAPDAAAFETARGTLAARFSVLESEIDEGP
jgi:glutathione S-transferase